MRLRHAAASGLAGLLTLVLLYVVLVVLILLFTRHIVSDLSSAGPLAGAGTAAVTVVLPLVLLTAIVLNLVRLFRERAQRRAGARLKTRMILSFVFIALLALIPQALLSTTFINSVINYWVSAGVGEALENGLTISLAYHTDKVRGLRSFAASPVVAKLLEDLPRTPEQAWRNITSTNPDIGLLQVFDASGRETFFRGDEKARVDDPASLRRDLPGVPVRKTRGDTTILRVTVPQTGSNTVVLAIVYPRTFDELASRITASRRVAVQLTQYQQVFRWVVVLFYTLFSIPILLLAILVSFLLTDDIIRPIVHLEEATRKVAEGDFSFRLLARRNDELASLVGSFNRMIAELESSRRKLVQAEKIETWKEIAQRLAHEIRNPLTPIKLSAQRILRKAESSPPGELKEVLEPAVNAIVREVDNLNKLLVEFREFARLPERKPESVDVRALLEEVLSVYRVLSASIALECRYGAERHSIMADRDQLRQAFANLVKNAIQAMPLGGRLVVATDLVSRDQTDYLRVRIQDNGQGMDAEARAKAFQPYFTTKNEGSGLGLAIVERIVFDHNGRIWFETEKGKGTTFFMDLPVGNPVVPAATTGAAAPRGGQAASRDAAPAAGPDRGFAGAGSKAWRRAARAARPTGADRVSRVLIIDDEPGIRDILSEVMKDEGHGVRAAEDGYKGLAILADESVDVVLLDVRLPNLGGIDVLAAIREKYPDTETIMISGHANIDLAVHAVKMGAFDFLEKPLDLHKTATTVANAVKLRALRSENQALKAGLFVDDSMIGASGPMQRVRELIGQSAASDSRILVLGANGTGKELVAREIHRQSRRAAGPFVEVNCAAIPESLIESELFGHEKGAFTHAVASRRGKFELAHRGTLFLDEIADMSLSTQAKVLRATQELKFERIGGEESISVDVRIIAATNKALEEEVRAGRFREDLYFRLAVIPIRVPSLRERIEDLPLLIAYFMDKFRHPAQGPVKSLDQAALDDLAAYNWPGNIRELKNFVERINIMVAEQTITREHVTRFLGRREAEPEETLLSRYAAMTLADARDSFEKELIQTRLRENGNNITRTAQQLGLYPSSLHSRIRKYGISIDRT